MGNFILTLVLALGPPTAQARSEDLDRDGLVALLKSQFDDLKDFEFRYEGELKRLQLVDDSKWSPNLRISPERREKYNSNVSYQGTFAYRMDRSAHQEIFYRHHVQKEVTQEDLKCLLGSKFGGRSLVVDRGGAVGPDQTRTAHLGALIGPYSPLLFVGYPLHLM